MNMNRLAVVSVLTVCGSLAPVTLAQSSPRPEVRQDRREARRDGASDKKKRELVKSAADSDGDGKLSPEEKKAAAEKVQSQRDRVKAKLDSDGDGKVSAAEWRAVSEEWGDFDADFDKTLGRLDAQARAALVKSLDSNGDGKLDDAERAAFRDKVLQARYDMLMKFDADGDGKLSGEERRALNEALHAAKQAHANRNEQPAAEAKSPKGDKKSGDNKSKGESAK